MAIPYTRLRYVKAKDPADIVEFLEQLTCRVQIYGCPQWDGKKWVLWFVPPDYEGVDVESQDL